MRILRLNIGKLSLVTFVWLLLLAAIPALAVACEGGFLEFTKGEPGEILHLKVNTPTAFNVKYTEYAGGGNSGTLTRKIDEGEPIFTTPGGTCGTPDNNLTNGQECTMEVKCTKVGEFGKIRVHSSRSVVGDALRKVECE